MNALIDLLEYGQSYWLDNLTRKKITSGEIAKRINQEGLRGITSNPSIFNKAISKSSDYDTQIAELVAVDKNATEIYEALTIKDVQDACDLLKPVFDESKGVDGFVSLEVSPYLARDTEGTIKEARRLHKAVGKENCLIKVPGTIEGIPAIEQLLYEGISINVTLIFSVHNYGEIAKAYLRAMQQRSNEGLPLKHIISVASVFVSRIDVLTDQLLAQHITSFKENSTLSMPTTLEGKAGVATAKLCYQRFEEIFKGEKWEKLKLKGAHYQRPLWASTSNKDPLFGDLRYVEPLIGNNTINTLPDETIKLFAEKGVLKANAIKEGLTEANMVFDDLQKKGIDIDQVTLQLENEGINKFTDAYNELITNLATKRMSMLNEKISSQEIIAATLKDVLVETYKALDEKQISKLLFEKDPYLWHKDTEQLKEIRHRLGWLTLPEEAEQKTKSIKNFALTVKGEGYTHAVLLGMGGSSLCSEVAKEAFGTAKEYMELHVLDNTSPEAILEVQKKINFEKTLFVVASKSGSTEETISFFHYFYDQLKNINSKNPGDHFIAITDHGTPLVKLGEEYHFRKIFLNDPDLGGRYSVLSDFGLVPMALMGIDITAFLLSAYQMEISCKDVPAVANPGISLGALLGVCENHGRDKITFVLSSSIKSFGYWVEQLLAESTGKEGKGLIPINGELLGDPTVYGNDRLFVHLFLKEDNTKEEVEKLNALEKAGHPVVRIKLNDKLALGAEYYRWEIAAAIAGLVIGINPFNQPNVEESKKNTSNLLTKWEKNGKFNYSKLLVEDDLIKVYGGKRGVELLNSQKNSVTEVLTGFLHEVNPNDYIALLPYFMLTDSRKKMLQNWRQQLRDNLKVATTLLEGPRYLHSTGQLHKGGPNTGLFLLIVADETTPLTIPGEKFGFDILHQAQPLGDFQSLDEKGRRILLINIGKDIEAGLKQLVHSIKNYTEEYTHH
ncbi:MAG: bifunctional transaldolase/phosoglucose isomerase [Bacteroidia bacterium]